MGLLACWAYIPVDSLGDISEWAWVVAAVVAEVGEKQLQPLHSLPRPHYLHLRLVCRRCCCWECAEWGAEYPRVWLCAAFEHRPTPLL